MSFKEFTLVVNLISNLIVLSSFVSGENCPSNYPSGCGCYNSSSKSILCDKLSSVTEFPRVFSRDTKILSLKGSKIEAITKDDLKNLTELESLVIIEGSLKSIEVGSLQPLKKLKWLSILRNKLETKTLYNGTFDNLTSLRVIHLDYNPDITMLPDNMFLNSPIETLSLMYTSLTRVSNQEFGGLSNLTTLNLHNCKIKYVEKEFLKGTKVTHVNLYENPIVKIDPDAMGAQIVDFECRRCGLTDADIYGEDNFIRKMTSLTRLSLGSNKISYVPKNAFRGLTKLKTLNLFYNNISYIEEDAFSELPQGASVAVQHNPFNCDCYLAWFHGYALKNLDDTAENMICNAPASLKGKRFKELKASQFCCSKPAICGTSPGKNTNNGQTPLSMNFDYFSILVYSVLTYTFAM